MNVTPKEAVPFQFHALVDTNILRDEPPTDGRMAQIQQVILSDPAPLLDPQILEKKKFDVRESAPIFKSVIEEKTKLPLSDENIYVLKELCKQLHAIRKLLGIFGKEEFWDYVRPRSGLTYYDAKMWWIAELAEDTVEHRDDIWKALAPYIKSLNIDYKFPLRANTSSDTSIRDASLALFIKVITPFAGIVCGVSACFATASMMYAFTESIKSKRVGIQLTPVDKFISNIQFTRDPDTGRLLKPDGYLMEAKDEEEFLAFFREYELLINILSLHRGQLKSFIETIIFELSTDEKPKIFRDGQFPTKEENEIQEKGYTRLAICDNTMLNSIEIAAFVKVLAKHNCSPKEQISVNRSVTATPKKMPYVFRKEGEQWKNTIIEADGLWFVAKDSKQKIKGTVLLREEKEKIMSELTSCLEISSRQREEEIWSYLVKYQKKKICALDFAAHINALTIDTFLDFIQHYTILREDQTRFYLNSKKADRPLEENLQSLASIKTMENYLIKKKLKEKFYIEILDLLLNNMPKDPPEEIEFLECADEVPCLRDGTILDKQKYHKLLIIQHEKRELFVDANLIKEYELIENEEELAIKNLKAISLMEEYF